jgi:hypothetical protein
LIQNEIFSNNAADQLVFYVQTDIAYFAARSQPAQMGRPIHAPRRDIWKKAGNKLAGVSLLPYI